MKNILSKISTVLKSPRMFYPTLGLVMIAILLLAGLFTDSPLNVANWFAKEETKGAEVIAEQPVEETIPTETEKETEPTPEPKEEPKPELEATISLTGKTYDTGVKLYWETKNLNADKGYKIVRSTSLNPVYPGDTYKYIANESQKSSSWEITNGKTYYFRVCQYLGSKCGTYSNNVKLTAPYVKEEPKEEASVKSINLSFAKFLTTSTTEKINALMYSPTQQAKVSWTVNGYSRSGFKLVWSKETNPVYPGDNYNYYSDPATTLGVVNADAGAGTYYVRVCEYLGGKCGVYSNQIEIDF